MAIYFKQNLSFIYSKMMEFLSLKISAFWSGKKKNLAREKISEKSGNLVAD